MHVTAKLTTLREEDSVNGKKAWITETFNGRWEGGPDIGKKLVLTERRLWCREE
jgi:hypothetical protein